LEKRGILSKLKDWRLFSYPGRAAINLACFLLALYVKKSCLGKQAGLLRKGKKREERKKDNWGKTVKGGFT
jgi:hypothetical protein